MAKPINVKCVTDTIMVRMPIELVNLLDRKVQEKNEYYQENNIKKKLLVQLWLLNLWENL